MLKVHAQSPQVIPLKMLNMHERTLCFSVQTSYQLVRRTTVDCWEENGKFEGISPGENSCCHQVGDFVVLWLFPQRVSMDNLGQS